VNFLSLDLDSLALAALLVLANAGLSLWLGLGLGRQLVVSALRMVVQLALVALVLNTLFTLVSPLWTGLVALLMIGFAGFEARARMEWRFRGGWSYGLGTTSIFFAATLVTLLALAGGVRPDPWYDPRFAIPLLGMVLGNTMTGVTLGMNTLTGAAVRERLAIEARISLGADRWTAFRAPVREAMRSGLIPIINAMAATGLVYLPGMMTGQILAGIEPFEAIKYQLLVMFLIAGGTGIGVFSSVFAGVARLTDSRHRLRLDRLAVRPPGGPGAGRS